jgi:hypothetical protein
MAENDRLKKAADYQGLVMIARNLESLSKELLQELKKFNQLAYSIKPETEFSDDVEDIKRRFGPDRRFEVDGFIVNTKLIDEGLHITWENKNQYIFQKRGYYREPSSIGQIAGNINGYRSMELISEENKGDLFLDTDKQKGEIIDYEIPIGKTVYYELRCCKIKELDVTSSYEDSNWKKPYTSKLQYDKILDIKSKEQGIEGEVIETVEDSELVKLNFDIRVPNKVESVELNPDEERMMKNEKAIMEAEGVLDVFEEIERRRKARLAKIESMDVAAEEKENMKKLANRVYADVASSRVKW